MKQKNEFKPKEGEDYWTIGFFVLDDTPFSPTAYNWANTEEENMILRKGWAFRNYRDALDLCVRLNLVIKDV